MATFPNRLLIGWNLSRKKGLRLIGLHNNGLGNNYEPAKYLMFGRSGRVIKMWDGAQWNRVALWEQENRFGSSAGYIQIDLMGHVTMHGLATVHDDLPSPLIGLRLESPSSHIVINAAEAAIDFKTNCDLTDYLLAVPQMTHKWMFGSPVHPHLHWEQTTSATPNWLIQYRWQRQGQAKTTGWTSLPWVENAFPYTSGTLNQITAFGEITPPVGYCMSDILDFRILRDTNNDSTLFTGADPVGVTVLAKSYDCHVEMDTWGSDEEYAK